MHDIFCDIEHTPIVETRIEKSKRKGKNVKKTIRKKRKPIQCLVRGNKVFFYGKAAKLVERGIAASGLTPDEFLSQAIKHALENYKLQGKIKA